MRDFRQWRRDRERDSASAGDRRYPSIGWRGWAGLKMISVALILGGFFGCSHPQPTLVVTVGGLGFSQMGDLRHAVQRECPRADVVSAGAWDAYKADLAELVRKSPHRHIVLVGHSFGCKAIADAARELPNVELAVFIDPAWDDFKLPHNILRYLWYRRSDFGVEREARIEGAAGPTTIQGNHNELPHSAAVIAGIVDAINRIKDSKSAPGASQPHGRMAMGEKD